MSKVIFVLLFIILSLSIVSCNYKKESTLKEENTTERILIKPTTAETGKDSDNKLLEHWMNG